MGDAPTWDGRSGTAGGATFGAALAELAREREAVREQIHHVAARLERAI